MKPKLALAAAALLVIALIVASGMRFRLAGDEVAPSNRTSASQVEADPGAAELTGGESPEARSPVEAPAEIVEVAIAPATSDAALLSGRVVTPDGAPIPDAQVRASAFEARDMSSLDLAYNAQAMPVASATTDANGEFAFPHRRGVPLDLEVSAEGYATQEVANRFAGEHVVVVLDRGSSVFGRVYDAVDQTGVAGAKVAVGQIGVRFKGEREPETLTDEAGNYRIDGLPPSAYELSLVSRDHRKRTLPDEMERIDLSAGESIRVDMALERGVTLRGLVTDALDDTPIGGAEVSDNWTFERSVTTDADGRYELRGLQLGRLFAVYVRAEGYAKTEDHPLLPLAGEAKLDFQLERGCEAWGRVVDPNGSPLGGVYVAAVGSSSRPSRVSGRRVQGIDWIPDRTDEHGRFILRDLRPSIGHALFLRRSGFGVRVYDFPAADPVSGSFDLGTLVLKVGGSISGRIVDEHGQPRADVAVGMEGTNADRDALAPGVEPRGGRYVSRRELRSDASGRFRFVDLAEGTYRFTASIKGNATSASGEIDLEEEREADVGDLVLARGGTIQGRVRDPRGEPLAWIAVSAFPEPRESGGRSTYTLTDAQGRFVLEALEGTTCTLEVEPFAGTNLRKRWEGILVGASDLVLVLPDPTPISGRVVAPDGEPVGGCLISIRSPEGTFLWGGAFSAVDGSFRLPVLEGEVQDLIVILADPSLSFPDPRRIRKTVDAVPSGTEGLLVTLPEKP